MPMPRAFASAGDGELDRLAAQHDLALVRGVDAGEDLHQGALAGAVLADQSVDLARQQVEIDAVERGRAAEALGDAAEREDRLRGVSMRSGGRTEASAALCRVRWLDCHRHGRSPRRLPPRCLFCPTPSLVLDVVVQPDVAGRVVLGDRAAVGADELRNRRPRPCRCRRRSGSRPRSRRRGCGRSG